MTNTQIRTDRVQANGLSHTESPWFSRRFDLLDFDQGLVVP